MRLDLFLKSPPLNVVLCIDITGQAKKSRAQSAVLQCYRIEIEHILFLLVYALASSHTKQKISKQASE